MSRRSRLVFYIEGGHLNVQDAGLHIRAPVAETFDLGSAHAAHLIFLLHAELVFRRSTGETGLWQL